MLRRNFRVKRFGLKKYVGDHKQICGQIVDDCWNKEKKYFQTSQGNYPEFYSRDFGWSCNSLINLGHKRKVVQTLDYALGRFQANKGIRVAISPDGTPFDFPNIYSIDSVAFTFRSLRLAENKQLISRYEAFLNSELQKFYDLALDKDTGLVRKDRFFSSSRDHALRESCCYDNVMVAMLAEDLKQMKNFDNPLRDYNFKKILKDSFWNGSYFETALSKTNVHVAGDANVLPFWSGVFTSTKMLKSCIHHIEKDSLDKPFPLRYVKVPSKEKMIPFEFLVHDWEQDSIWAFLGMFYIEVLAKVNKDKARTNLLKYKHLIDTHKTFLEVFDRTGKPYESLVYYCDEGMIWSAQYLDLANRLRI